MGSDAGEGAETSAPAYFSCEVEHDYKSGSHMRGPHNNDRREPFFLTTEEVADVLRTSRKAVYAMIERRQLPGVTRLGRRVLVRTDDLLDWLRQKSECHR